MKSVSKKSLKEIRVTVGKQVLVNIEDLIEFQGELKDLDKDSYEKGKASILKHGFSFCPHFWSNGGKKYILDGHQRKRILMAMKEEGYTIPKVPAVEVMADNLKDAKERVLAAAAQYGKVTYEGLNQFLEEAKIDYKTVDVSYQFPEIDFERFEKTFYIDAPELETKEVSFTATEKEDDDDDKTCPKCGFTRS